MAHSLLHSSNLQTEEFLKGIYGSLAKGSPLTARILFEKIKGAAIKFSRSDGIHGSGTRFTGQAPKQTEFNYTPVTESTSVFYADFRVDKAELARMVDPASFIQNAVMDQMASISRAYAHEFLLGDLEVNDAGLNGVKNRIAEDLVYTATNNDIDEVQLQLALLALQPANPSDLVIVANDFDYVKLVNKLASKHLLERSTNAFNLGVVSFNGAEIIRMSTFQKQVKALDGTFSTVTVNPLPKNETVDGVENTSSIYILNLASGRLNGIEGEQGITVSPYEIAPIWKGNYIEWHAGLAEFTARSAAVIKGIR
ncbi:hypothetical protein MHB65_19975 [Lysinibacillus sp. FSL K6-0075]|uniref:hypothetical protein n=1 Tax=Lysinibacillus sp. FSL K6-0075 TaxID=2921415 RepID=UPI0031586FE5